MIKVSELAFIRLRVPNLDLQEQFLLDFGLLPAGGKGRRRFYRTTDDMPYCYSIEEGPAGFLGCGFHAASHSDLDRLSQETGLPIEPIDAPGGGVRVRLTEPNGYAVDIVHGIERVPPVAVARLPANTAHAPFMRKGALVRLARNEATPVKRIAHVVFGTPKVDECVAWWADTLGLIATDDIVAGPDKRLIGSFMRVNKGEEFVDHHAVFIMGSPVAGLAHVSFESQDFDGVMADHHFLKNSGKYEHAWGVGRHLLGSQIFDYWADPHGFLHEHWTDSDRLDASTASTVWDVREGLISQWGEEAPDRIREGVRP